VSLQEHIRTAQQTEGANTFLFSDNEGTVHIVLYLQQGTPIEPITGSRIGCIGVEDGASFPTEKSENQRLLVGSCMLSDLKRMSVKKA
jgi:hypothetical protein